MQPQLDLRARLLNNGCTIGDRVGFDEIICFEKRYGLKLSSDLTDFQTTYGEIELQASWTIISLWPIRLWKTAKSLKEDYSNPSHFAIGDVLLNSDYIVTNVSDDNKNLFLLFEQVRFASSMGELLVTLSKPFD